MTPLKQGLAAATLALAGLAAQAASVTYAGNLGDTANPYLEEYDLSPADFSSDLTIANNVALYQLVLTQAGTLTLSSSTYSGGGIDPYVTLFAGSDMTATLVGSAIDDFSWSLPVTAGDYWVAIADWDNMSFAENLGTGTLADGFIGLGQAGLLGDGSYSVRVSLDTGTPPVPEPSPAWLLAAGLAATLVASRRKARQPIASELQTSSSTAASSGGSLPAASSVARWTPRRRK